MNKFKTPLSLLTATIAIIMGDYLFALDLSEEVYGVLGITMLGTVLWMWFVVHGSDKNK